MCGVYSVIFVIGLFICIDFSQKNLILVIISIILYVAIFCSFVFSMSIGVILIGIRLRRGMPRVFRVGAKMPFRQERLDDDDGVEMTQIRKNLKAYI